MLNISIVGLGLMGQQHLKAIEKHPSCSVASIIDNSKSAIKLAEASGHQHFIDLETAIDKTKPDGIIVATPNARHFNDGLVGLRAGIPILVEKPLSDSLEDAANLVKVGKERNVPILTGYHRRHNPIVSDIKEKINSGFIGQVVSMHGMFWLYKPEDYFEQAWRKKKGAGPIYINLSHDIDLMRHFLGEIETVQSITSNNVRGFEVEDTSVAILKFSSGVIGSISISDTIVSPWSYELTSNENPAYHHTNANCYWIGGTEGSIELPKGTIWSYKDHRSWWEPISCTTIVNKKADPIYNQLNNFLNVINHIEEPLVSGLEGLKTSAVISAIKIASQSKKLERPLY